MTPALNAAIGAYYRKAVVEANRPAAVQQLVATLGASADLTTEARSEKERLETFSKGMGGVDRLRQRDFVGATTLQGLIEALAQL